MLEQVICHISMLARIETGLKLQNSQQHGCWEFPSQSVKLELNESYQQLILIYLLDILDLLQLQLELLQLLLHAIFGLCSIFGPSSRFGLLVNPYLLNIIFHDICISYLCKVAINISQNLISILPVIKNALFKFTTAPKSHFRLK